MQPVRLRGLSTYRQDLFANSRTETQIHFDCFTTRDSLRLGTIYSGRFADDSQDPCLQHEAVEFSESETLIQ
jgi:hypothetical protein